MVPISQMTKPRHGEFKSRDLGHIAGEMVEQGVNPGSVVSEPLLVITPLSCRGWIVRLH